MSVTLARTTVEGGTCVTVAGEVDVSNADELRATLDACLLEDVSAIEVDLAEVSYIDSTGIGVLVGAAHRAEDEGISYRVVRPQRNVARVLSLLGVDEKLGVRPQ